MVRCGSVPFGAANCTRRIIITLNNKLKPMVRYVATNTLSAIVKYAAGAAAK